MKKIAYTRTRIKRNFNQSAVLFERCALNNLSGIY